MKSSKLISNIVSAILFLVSGILCFVFPDTSAKILTIFIGVLTICGGLAQIIVSFTRRRSFLSFAFDLVFGILYIMYGIIMVTNTSQGMNIISVIIAFYLLLYGSMQLYVGIQYTKVSGKKGIFPTITGGFMLAFGIILMFTNRIDSHVFAYLLGSILLVSAVMAGINIYFALTLEKRTKKLSKKIDDYINKNVDATHENFIDVDSVDVEDEPKSSESNDNNNDVEIL